MASVWRLMPSACLALVTGKAQRSGGPGPAVHHRVMSPVVELCSGRLVAARQPQAASLARELVAGELAGVVDAGAVDQARLLVTELVTNSVRHGDGSHVEVVVQVLGDGVRVEVADDGVGFSGPRRPDPVNGGGYGLNMVGALARDWGIDDTCGCRVWFELAA